MYKLTWVLAVAATLLVLTYFSPEQSEAHKDSQRDHMSGAAAVRPPTEAQDKAGLSHKSH